MPTRKQLRVNIVVTEEQHALLSELAELDSSVRSSAGFVRELLDQVTPLLRVTVPMMRTAAQEMDSSRSQLREPLREFLSAVQQLDLVDAASLGAAPEPQRSEDGRPAPRRRLRKSSSKHSQ